MGAGERAFGVAGHVQPAVGGQCRALAPVGGVGADVADPLLVALGVVAGGEAVETAEVGAGVERAGGVAGDVGAAVEGGHVEAPVPSRTAELPTPQLVAVGVEAGQPDVGRSLVGRGEVAVGEAADVDRAVGRHRNAQRRIVVRAAGLERPPQFPARRVAGQVHVALPLVLARQAALGGRRHHDIAAGRGRHAEGGVGILGADLDAPTGTLGKLRHDRLRGLRGRFGLSRLGGRGVG